jgi:hypothetical protein
MKALLLLVLAASPCRAADSALQKRLLAIVDAFYDLRFDEARAGAEAIERDFPGHPAGPFYASMVHYQRYIVEDPPSPETLAAFEAGNERALKACAAALESDPLSAERYFGAALGFHARALIAKKRFAPAISKARKAVAHLRKAAALDPADKEIMLGLGMYDYFLSRVPLAAKPFAYLMMGMRGNRERGLERLKTAAESDGPARMEARAVLSAIYGSRNEKRWGEAQDLLAELAARYPRNPLYRLRSVLVAERAGDYARAEALAEPDGPWLEKIEPTIRERARLEARRRSDEIAALKAGKLKEPSTFRWPLPSTPES